MSTVPTLKDKIAKIKNQCTNSPAEIPYEKSCKLKYSLTIQVLKICGEPLKGAKITINPYNTFEDKKDKVSNLMGIVTFEKLKRKSYRVSVEYEGLKTKVKIVPVNSSVIIQYELDDVKDDKFKITLIPKIMRKNGWIKGAELMEHWFKQKKYQLPEKLNLTKSERRKFYDNGKIPYNKSIITLAWVKEFELTKDYYDEIWEKKRYISPAIKRSLKKECIDKGIFNKVNKIGSKYNVVENLSTDVNILNHKSYQQNLADIVEGSDQLKYAVYKEHDDLMAALANFSFRMAIEYSVEFTRIENSYDITTHWFKADEKKYIGKKKVYTFSVTKVALYIRDSYDFNGVNKFGGLGSWNIIDKDLDAFNWISIVDDYVNVTNKMFREWRDENNCGGDFLVFSDIETRLVNDTWEVVIDI